MVTKKYLCVAPRPENWDDKAAALLQTFGGDVKKRDKTIRQTLQQLRAMHQYERRAGPGRKSNAEHALAFYEYILEGKDNGDGDGDGDGGGDGNGDGDDVCSATIESMDSQEFLNVHNDECDVCSLGGDLLCCSTCSLVFHLDCVRPTLDKLPDGDWLCAHCVLSGAQGRKKHSKAWKTASAAVRHMGRLRSRKQREKEGEEEENASGENDEDESKPESFKAEDMSSSKASATATSSVASKNSQDEDEDEGEEQDAVSGTETDSHENGTRAKAQEGATIGVADPTPTKPKEQANEDQDEDSEQKDGGRRNLALYKLSDSLSPSLKAEVKHEETGRSRRPRRQPTLYNPQICPDSRWQSDERTESIIRDTAKQVGGDTDGSQDNMDEDRDDERDQADKNTNESEQNIADDTKTPLEGKHTESEKEDGEDDTPLKATAKDSDTKTADDTSGGEEGVKKFYWCHFCRDDPAIPVCVFCACRICFAKHEKEKLLLCDKCDEEYHTFCLSPPLTSVPSAKKWFCPTCDLATTPSASTNDKISTRRTSSGGTPKSNAEDTPAFHSSSAKKESIKSPVASIVSALKLASSSPKTPAKISTGRPRGRPPKNKSPQPPSSETPTPRKRGRPPKSATPVAAIDAPPPRKRGRPPKYASSISPGIRKKPGPKLGSTNKRSVSPSLRNKASEGASASKKGRTDPASNPTGQTEEFDATEPLDPLVATVKIMSRSGRIVKRSSFHDELDQGEQHLRSAKKAAMEMAGLQRRERTDDPDTSQDNVKQKTVVAKIGMEDIICGSKDETVEGEDGSVEVDTPDAHDHDEMSEASPDLPVRRKIIGPPTESKQVPPPMPTSPAMVPMEIHPKPESVEAPMIESNSITPEDIEVECHKKIEENSGRKPSPENTSVIATSGDDQSKEASMLTQVGPTEKPAMPVPVPVPVQAPTATSKPKPAPPLKVNVKELVKAAIANIPTEVEDDSKPSGPVKVPRRKPGARECMQISRRFGVRVIPKKYMDTLFDYCTRGKVEHLIRMRERLDDHSRFLESQLAGLEAIIAQKGTSDVVVPPMPERPQTDQPKVYPVGVPSAPTFTPRTKIASSLAPPPVAPAITAAPLQSSVLQAPVGLTSRVSMSNAAAPPPRN